MPPKNTKPNLLPHERIEDPLEALIYLAVMPYSFVMVGQWVRNNAETLKAEIKKLRKEANNAS